MKTRNSLIVLALVLAVAGAVTWFFLRRTSGHSTETKPIRSVPELEELVYRAPFDADLELELARASCQKFEQSMETDQAAASECLTAYMFASFESGTRKDIFNEFQEHWNSLSKLASVPEGSFDYDMLQKLYSAGPKPNIQHILNIRNDLEAICERIHADDRGLEAVIAAQVAVERYLQFAYDVEVGREQIHVGEGTFHFTQLYYKNWESGMRSYGVTLKDSAVMNGSISAPFDSDASQIVSGLQFGRFLLRDGREVIPGLRYFEDAAATAATPDNSGPGAQLPAGSTPAAGSEADPVAVYRRSLQMREQGRWSEIYDLLEAKFQQDTIAKSRQAIREQLSDPNDQQRFDAFSDREIWIQIGRTGEVSPIQIIGADVHEDTAVIHVRVHKGESQMPEEVNLVRVNGAWKFTSY